MITSFLEYVSLVTKMAQYHNAYHQGDASDITDSEYDQLRKELIEWETTNPDQTLEFSPTRKVGSINKDKRKEEYRHDYPMLSLENALNQKEAQTWINKWTKQFGEEVEIIGEFKYDGLAVSLRYLDGTLLRALTRGDGEYGEDITKHVVENVVPLNIDLGGLVEIRGELIIRHGNLNHLKYLGEDYANCRSAVVGIMNPARQVSSKYSYLVDFAPYDIEGPDLRFEKYTNKLEILKQLEFQKLSCFIITTKEIQETFEQIKAVREQDALGFDIDGMVFKINDLNKQALLGETSHSPRHSFAYKFPPITAHCKILDVVFQVGRSGEISPVAKITATTLMGVIVTSVSLHNEEKMLGRNIAIGNTYEVYRSGDVIPHLGNLITSVNKETVKFPQCCPSCNRPLEKKGAIYYCNNSLDCTDQIKASIAYAVSKEVLDISNMAETTVDLMLRQGLISNVADIFNLQITDIETLPGFASYSARKLYYSILDAGKTTFDRFILALNIPEVGKSTAKKLAHRIFIRKALFDLDTPEKVMELRVEDIGLVTANNIAQYFSHPTRRANAEALLKQLRVPEMGQPLAIEGVAGKGFVFTGKFNDSREMLENKVLMGCGRVTSAISNSTDYLVAGDKPGTKLNKARLLNIEVIDERHFLSLFENTHRTISDELKLDELTPINTYGFQQLPNGQYVGYHVEGCETFELAGCIPLSMQTLHDDRQLYLSASKDDWFPTHLKEKDFSLYEIHFEMPKHKEFDSYNEYWKINPTWSDKTRSYTRSKELNKLITQGYEMFSIGENEKGETPESFIINPTKHVKSITKILNVGYF